MTTRRTRAHADTVERLDVAVIGAGPAGLAAAEAAASRGRRVVVFDWTPSPARKFLMAGKSGLNIANRATGAALIDAYGPAGARLRPMLEAFGSDHCVEWCEGLGQELFVGTSGRVFPTAMKASPLLRAWLARLEGLGVTLRRRWRWARSNPGDALVFETPEGPAHVEAAAVVLALGGASWPRLGSDAAWTTELTRAGVEIAPFRASNVGVEIPWSAHFVERFAGAPVKGVSFRIGERRLRGEAVATATGLEGGAIYTLGPAIRAERAKTSRPRLTIDLAPDRPQAGLAADLARQPAKASLSNRLRKAARLEGVKAALLREAVPDIAERATDPERLAATIKAAPLSITGLRPIAEAISSAGGVTWASLDQHLMLRARPGAFCAGEMIDWDAPTGGFLLTACLATGRWAGAAAAEWAQAHADQTVGA